MSASRFVLLFAATIACGLAPSSHVAAQDSRRELDIVVPNTKSSAAICIRALLDTRDRLKPLGVEIKTTTFADSLDREGVTYVLPEVRENPLDMTSIPFAFRDAAHFQAYLGSSLFRRLQTRTEDDTVATAYGGFFQMFSRVAAVTEPKHLYRRYIGGDVHSVDLYLKVGARIVPWFLQAKFNSDYDYHDDVARLARGNQQVDIVEAPLNSAFESGLDRAARYVDLISSAVIPISLQLRDSHVKMDARLQPQERTAVVAWMQAAAAACSASNYRQELATLEKLKQEGLQVVPFDRHRLIAASWRAALLKPHDYWTVAEFDELVSLGGGTPNVPLPSEILKKLAPKQRRQAETFAQAAEKHNRP